MAELMLADTIISAPNVKGPCEAPTATKQILISADMIVVRVMVDTAPADSKAVEHKEAGTMKAIAIASSRARSTD